MPRRVHLLSPDHGGLPRRHHTPPVTATCANAAVWTARVDAGRRPEPTLPPPETSICVSSPTLSVARPVAVMVTSDRRHAVMIFSWPRLLHAGRHCRPSTPGQRTLDVRDIRARLALRPLSPVHPWTTNTPSSVMMRKGRAGHRTVERADEHDPEPVPEEERELREDRPGDEDRSANRPQSAQIVLQSVIESRSKLGME